jgi:peptidoglycan/xylan/chitin deacetylase (PgdA/CDA1 family)
MNRRGVLTGSALVAAGAAGVLGVETIAAAVTAHDPLPVYGGPASAIHDDRTTAPVHRTVEVHWGVNTTKQLVALTFDDGPMPQWTPEVLDLLEQRRVPATFFMVGRNADTNRALVAGRLAEHEVGNHTWAHDDLAKADYRGARDAIERAHRVLAEIAGRDPVLLRPPYGHLAGAAMLAAADLGYHMMLWNLQMLESNYVDKPAGLVDYIVNSATPGTVLLAHDTGKNDRLVAIRHLPEMIDGLRRRGFEFVTASQLLAEA